MILLDQSQLAGYIKTMKNSEAIEILETMIHYLRMDAELKREAAARKGIHTALKNQRLATASFQEAEATALAMALEALRTLHPGEDK